MPSTCARGAPRSAKGTDSISSDYFFVAVQAVPAAVVPFIELPFTCPVYSRRPQ